MEKKKPKGTNSIHQPTKQIHSKRVPELIVFEEPGVKRTNKRQNNSGKSRNLQIRNTNNRFSNFNKSEEDDNELDFTRIAREVRDFGSTGLWKGHRKKYEKDKLFRLGAHKSKSKVPYPVGIERHKKKMEKEERERERDKAMGVIRKKIQKDDRKKLKLKQRYGRWVDKAPDLDRIKTNLKKVNVKKMK